MKTVTRRRLAVLLRRLQGKRIGVVGDLMLDRYLWGSVHRISPEAPVPVVDIEEESMRLGGAANVANNVRALGGVPVLMGVIGKDTSGGTLRRCVGRDGFETGGLLVDRTRPTTVKTRVIAHNQQLVRTDRESREPLRAAVETRLIRLVEKLLPGLDGVILEDYNKGLFTSRVIREIVALVRGAGVPVGVDPKFTGFFEYEGVTVFKPNQREAEAAVGRRLETDADVDVAGVEILRRLQCENVLLTRGDRGMALYRRGRPKVTVPTHAREVSDVSGAGDTVIGALVSFLVAGADIEEAASLANHAAGIVCAEVGVVPIQPDQLRRALPR